MSAAAELVVLNIGPEVTGDLPERVLELVISLTISQHKVSGMHSSTIEGLIRKGVLKEVLLFPDHVVADLGLDVPLAKGVSNLAEPCLSSNKFRVKAIVGNYVNRGPPSIVQVTEPLMMHSHLDEAHGGKVACGGRGNHLTIIDNTHV